MNKYWFLLIAGALLFVSACSESGHDEEIAAVAPPLATLTGEVFYRDPQYLPPGAELHITLEDVSKVGARSTVIAESTILLAGRQPYAFTLDYSPADIDARMQYALRAKITFYGELLFTSARRVDPFKHPGDTISIELTMIGSSE